MIKHYLLLQYKIGHRHLTDFGVHPVFGLVGGLVLFGFISIGIFQKIAYPQYVYAVLPLALIQSFDSLNRVDFLKRCYSKKDFTTIRIVENSIIALPFFVFLCFFGMEIRSRDNAAFSCYFEAKRVLGLFV